MRAIAVAVTMLVLFCLGSLTACWRRKAQRDASSTPAAEFDAPNDPHDPRTGETTDN
jgi:hypothetical protein